jgi:hypothetical protein
MALNVFVEGSKDSSALGVKRLATLIAARYGLPAVDLEKRIANGRFRVKANVDEATATAFAADLESLGARCSIAPVAGATTVPPPATAGSPAAGPTEPAVTAGSPTAGPTATPAGPAEPARPRESWAPPAASTALPAIEASPASNGGDVDHSTTEAPRSMRRTSNGSALMKAAPAMSRTATLPMTGLAVRPASPTSPNGLTSALADATYRGGGLGALETTTFSLATLDGKDDPSVATLSPAAFAPAGAPAPSAGHSSSMLPTAPDPAAASGAAENPFTRARRPAQGIARLEPSPGIDLFAPPLSEGPQTFSLAEEPRVRRGSLAPEGAPMVAPAIAPLPAIPMEPKAAADAARIRRTRMWFAGGVLAAVLVGFVPVHFIARGRERAAFATIDARVRATQSNIATMEEWNALDDIRTARLRQKQAAQQEIALLSVLLWIGISGGLSLAWARWAIPKLEPQA